MAKPTTTQSKDYAGGLTDIQGIRVGHFTDSRRPTGCTVVLVEAGAVAGVDVRGSAPGTRETDLLKPHNTVQKVHGIVLSGGSAFGLDSAIPSIEFSSALKRKIPSLLGFFGSVTLWRSSTGLRP